MTALATGRRAGPAPAAGAQRSTGRSYHPRVLIWLLAGVMVLATGEVVVDGTAGRSPLIPKSPAIAGWMSGLGERLGFRIFLIALLAFSAAYVGLLLLHRRVSPRLGIGLLGLLHLLLFVGPVLLSTDVFSYIAYARMGVVHGINPYLHGPEAIMGDPVFYYVGHDWKNVATAYGPLYTLLSYPLAPLGIKGALWGMKLEALLASLGTLALTWRCARLRGIDPMFALLAVGANPLYVLYGVGGAHNDLIMILFTMAGVALMLSPASRPQDDPAAAGRPRRTLALGGRRAMFAGGAVMAATLVKATGIVPLPFMVLSRRRLAPVIGAAFAAAAVAAVAYAVFGLHGIDLVSALNRDAAFVSTDSFPTEIAHLFGKPGVFPVDHDLLKGALVIVVAYLLVCTWRGYDWVAASGWTLLAISVTSTWLLAWYILWPLPLAAVGRDRRLLWATLGVQGLFIVHQISPLLAPVQ